MLDQIKMNGFFSFLLLLLANTDRLQQVKRLCQSYTRQLKKVKTIYSFHKIILIEETAAMNVSTERLITMDYGSHFQLDIVRRKNDSCL